MGRPGVSMGVARRAWLWGALLVALLLAGCQSGPEFITAGTPNRAWRDVIRDFDGVPMVYVPAGCFHAGRAEGASDERPVRRICLTGFWISRTEVTNAQYQACVEAGACTPPVNPVYYNTARLADHPVVHVTADQAAEYAVWRGGALPSEFQWEYAARGTESTLYPWGFAEPDCNRANYGACATSTSLTGENRRTDGASWVGALDMAGNVSEWTATWYDDTIYFRLENDVVDPIGPEDGRLRVLRGGAWGDAVTDILPTLRDRHTSVSHSDRRGFRFILRAPL